jgi:hypothetical protein
VTAPPTDPSSPQAPAESDFRLRVLPADARHDSSPRLGRCRGGYELV